MDGEGGRTVESSRSAGDFDLPAILAQLDDSEPESQRRAVETVREAVDDRPESVIPTVPKLRSLLAEPAADVREEVAYCLAELAAASPDDVAPSAGALASFAADHASHPATRDVLRCLTVLAEERPAAVVDHVGSVVAVLESRPASEWGVATVAAVSREYPAAIEPAAPALERGLATAPETVAGSALPALGRLARSDATLSPSFVDEVVELVDHETARVRNNAIGCLADVAHFHPAAVEEHCPTIADALEREDPTTRANAAVTIARVAAGTSEAVVPARDRLLELLEDEHARVRANACVALGNGGVEAARDRLEELAADDPEPPVRERASWALSKLP